ncbi:hypothetical protein NQ318_004559 [Aromia moschata]|uniref:DUF4817 domain-containing protein n=1 Tax=Aromia moschata TaxID=1265417 RepID=A0AAV8Y7F9_9CUCU|nr:hypothetical protein NQ318_004559 [Aromia moschata]
MSYLTESLKIEILMMIGYGDRARTQCEVVRLFRETHPDLPPLNQGTISKIEAQYREMGHVRKIPSKRQAVVDDDTKLNLLLALEENPITPARQLARDIQHPEYYMSSNFELTIIHPLKSYYQGQILGKMFRIACGQEVNKAKFTLLETLLDGRNLRIMDIARNITGGGASPKEAKRHHKWLEA